MIVVIAKSLIDFFDRDTPFDTIPNIANSLSLKHFFSKGVDHQKTIFISFEVTKVRLSSHFVLVAEAAKTPLVSCNYV